MADEVTAEEARSALPHSMPALGPPPWAGPRGANGQGWPPPFLFVPGFGRAQLPPRLPGGRIPAALVPSPALPLLAVGALTVVSQLYRRWHTRVVERDWGMTGPRVSVLVMLTQARSLTMGEIAQVLDVTPRAVTRLVDGLEDDGLVLRARDPQDKRVVHVTCTSRALALARERMPALASEFARLFEGFDEAELRTYVEVASAVGERLRVQLEAEDDGEEQSA